MEELKHSKIGIISFVLVFIPIIYVVIQTIIDIFTPISTSFNKSFAISYYMMNFMFAISLTSFILGIVAISKKGYKKGLPISSVIINGLILLIPTISFVKGMI